MVLGLPWGFLRRKQGRGEGILPGPLIYFWSRHPPRGGCKPTKRKGGVRGGNTLPSPTFLSYRQRRCIHSHCPGCSRTQPSTMRFISAVAAATSIGPSRRAAAPPPRSAPAGSRHRARGWRARHAPGSRSAGPDGRPAGWKGRPAEEGHLRPAAEALVDQHADMQPLVQRLHHADRRLDPGRDQPCPCSRCRSATMSRATCGLFGVRYSTAAGSPCLAAAIAGNSQFARCAAKNSAGLPSSRNAMKRSTILGRDADAARPRGGPGRNPRAVRDGRIRTAVRPRLSQASRAIRACSAVGSSGKAWRILSSAMRLHRQQRPEVARQAAPKPPPGPARAAAPARTARAPAPRRPYQPPVAASPHA